MREYFVWLFKLITLIVVFCIVIPVILGAVGTAVYQLKDTKLASSGKHKVGVVEVSGVITDAKDTLMTAMKLIEDPAIDGLVIKIDSPGGAVGPSQELFETLKQLRTKKPIVSVMGSVAASGGFYTALAASKVLAQKGTITGSIGVIIQVPNFSAVADKVGVEMVTIKSGALKDVGNSFRAMTPDERMYLEGQVQSIHEQFISDVAAARNLPIGQVRKIADGRVITGEDAKNLGLIDGFGGIYDGARMIYELKGRALPEGEYPELVFDTDPWDEVKKYMEGIETRFLGGSFVGAPKAM